MTVQMLIIRLTSKGLYTGIGYVQHSLGRFGRRLMRGLHLAHYKALVVW